MKTKLFLVTSMATVMALSAVSQTAGGGGSAGGGGTAGGGAAAGGGVGSTTSRSATQPLTPGATSRQQLVPRTGQVIPSSQAIMTTNQFVITNQAGGNTNQFFLTNQFVTTNRFFITNQLASLSNQLFIATNQFAIVSNGVTPTSGFTNAPRIYPTNAAAFNNLPGALMQDHAVTATDWPILAQIHRVVQQATTPGSRLSTAHFIVQGGMVVASGSVPTANERQQIISMIQGIPGVTQVIDHLQTGAGTPRAISTVPGVSAAPAASGVPGTSVPGVSGVQGVSGITLFTNQFGIVTTNLGNTPIIINGATGTLTPTSESNSPTRVFPAPPGQ